MRNLFGWSSPPKRKDRKYSRLRAAALQDLISGKAAHQIFVDIEEHGDGYVIPLSLLNIMSQDDGTVEKLGVVKHASGTAAGTTAAKVTAPAGIWEVLEFQASYLVDATVADRTCGIRVPKLGMAGQAGTFPTTLLFMGATVTLSASQYGYITAAGRALYLSTTDNGTTADFASSTNPQKLIFAEGGEFHAAITANGQAGDAVGIDVLWRKVG